MAEPAHAPAGGGSLYASCGAFAVIRLCMYFTGYFTLCGTVRLGNRELLCMGLSFVLPRSLWGFAIAIFPLAKNTGLAHGFSAEGVRSRGRLILGGAAELAKQEARVIRVFCGLPTVLKGAL